MSIFDKFNGLKETIALLQSGGPMPVGTPIDQLHSATEGNVLGQSVILAGTNNYLGLTFHPDIIAAAKQALDLFGTGSTGSRMTSGTYADHLMLESELANFFEKSSTIIFSTGYQANLGIISTLTEPKDSILMDADSHASIYDGARMSGADIYRFRHNDPDDLAKRLRRLGKRASNTLIILEGLYSMLGDQAPLREFIEVKEKYGGYLMLDEAHSLGVLGPEGQGLAAHLGLMERVDFIVGTFSKSLGCVGGYCASSLPEMELVRNATRAYMFTASPTPSVVATARAALKIVSTQPELRTNLWRHSHRLYALLKEYGFQLGPEPGPVIATTMASPEQAVKAWRLLLAQGVHVNLALPPSTPGDIALLRCSLSAAHSDEQIDHIARGYAEVAKQIYGLNHTTSTSHHESPTSLP